MTLQTDTSWYLDLFCGIPFDAINAHTSYNNHDQYWWHCDDCDINGFLIKPSPTYVFLLVKNVDQQVPALSQLTIWIGCIWWPKQRTHTAIHWTPSDHKVTHLFECVGHTLYHLYTHRSIGETAVSGLECESTYMSESIRETKRFLSNTRQGLFKML